MDNTERKQKTTTAPQVEPVEIIETDGRDGGQGASRNGHLYKSVLDRAFLSLLRWDGEKLAWTLLILVAFVARVAGLGERAINHDESLHALYSWKLYDGQGYQHSPMMHGPLKFILNALMYFVFGVNDWSARIQVALFGVLMIGLVWLLRPWLGRLGAFLAALMFTISPALLYHSRYIRDEVMLTALLVLLAASMFRYLAGRETKWLVWTAVALALAFTTMEASFIFGAVFGAFLVLALAGQLWLLAWPGSEGGRRGQYRLAVAVAFPALLLGVLFLAFKLPLPGLVLAGVGAAAAVAALLLAVSGWRSKLREFAELDLIVLFLTLVLPFLSAVILKVLRFDLKPFLDVTEVSFASMAPGWIILAVMFVLSALLGWYWLGQRWFTAGGLFWAIELLLFTTFLTNGQGINTGLIGSLGYWIDQQEVMRGGQPWYYFFLMVPLYEFLPLLLALGGTIAWFVGAGERREGKIATGAARVPDPANAATLDGETTATFHQAAPVDKATTHRTRALFITFLVFWTAGTWAVFTYVGEKMPWHVVYFTTPMALLGGWWLGRVVEGIDWAQVRARGGLWLLPVVPIVLLVLKALFPMAGKRPFNGIQVTDISNTAQWLLALVVGTVIIYFAWGRVAAIGPRQGVRLVGLALAGLLAVATFGMAYRFAFITYDYATEPMVYAHGTPDLKLAMDQIEEISRKTVGGHDLKIAYDDDSTWPLEWYLRDYNKRAYYAATPTRDALDAPVIIVGDKNLTKVQPYVGSGYYEFKYRLVWWPRETYKDLTWQRIWDGIRDPVQRGQFWNVVIHRRYTTPTAEWQPPYVHFFHMFVRKDVAGDIWRYGAAPVAPVETDPFVANQRDVAAVLQLGTVGTPGSGGGQFAFPRAVAVGGDGTIYVADSGNNRIQVFGADGHFIRQWGSTCKLQEAGQGCVGEGQGQFNEPWGIAVGPDGLVYVTDTWNHRVQVFDGEGNFVRQWGQFDTTQGELGTAGVFYGPRALAVGADGNVYVMDTGNKRVQAFRPDGTFVGQWGGGGVVEGRFDEPVGLAQDGTGQWYVTDSWNKRVQVFDSQWNYVRAWSVNGWGSQNVTNKPYVAVDSARGWVYVSDPEGYRVLVYGTDGSVQGSWGMYGNDERSLTLPTGLAVGPDGQVYVADGEAHRIMVFPPWQ